MLRVIAIPGINCGGVYTHLSLAATRGNGATLQLSAFEDALASLKHLGFHPANVHVLNSAGALRFTNHKHNLVRCGTLLYGQYPPNVPHCLDLQPTWALKARIISMREIPAGTGVGYGAEWVARRLSRIATIPIGYADGPTLLPRSAWERGNGLRGVLKRLLGRDRILVITSHGPAPVAGRVAAQSAMLDVTDLDGVQVGDVVEVPSRRVLVGEHISRIALTR
jgi:alanine racemase